MKTMRSAVCKRANELVKAGSSKSAAFKKAWAEVKFAAKSIMVSDLTAGSTVRVEYGVKGNFVTCAVTDICKTKFDGRYYVIKGKALTGSLRGYSMDFTAKPDERLEKAA